MSAFVLAYISCPPSEAESLSQKILESHLAACIHHIPSVMSRYWWDGKLQKEEESLLILKTRSSCIEKLKEKVPQWHSYQNPELIFLSIDEGLPAYLHWLTQETQR
jgi:periplasmic divalent cation tolerance protein